MVTCVRFVALALLCLVNVSQAAEFVASVDRNQLTIDEHLLLTLSLLDSDTRLRAEGVSPNVDLSLISKDFDVGTPRNHHQYNIFRSRGRVTSELVVELFPKRIGKLTIPSFQIDDLHSNPIDVTVKSSEHGNAPLAFSRSGLSSPTPWQNEQVLVYLDIYTRVELKSAKLSDDLSTAPVPLELLDARKLPNSKRSEDVNGFRYRVIRNSWTLHPSTPDNLTLLIPDVWIVTTTEQKLRLPPQEQIIHTKRLPDAIAPDTMIGNTNIEVHATTEGTSNANFFTWTVSLTTSASFKNIPLDLVVAPIPGVQVYSDRGIVKRQESADGIKTIASYRVSAIALEPGTFALPVISVPYFDPGVGELRNASTAPLTFSSATGSRATNRAPGPSLASPRDEGQNDKILWQISTLLFVALWLVTLWTLRKQLQGQKEQRLSVKIVTDAPQHNDRRRLETRLLNALGSRSLSEGLSDWKRLYGDDATVTSTVMRVQQHYYSPSSPLDENTLADEVAEAVKKVNTKRLANTKSPDYWSPGSFSKPC